MLLERTHVVSRNRCLFTVTLHLLGATVVNGSSDETNKISASGVESSLNFVVNYIYSSAKDPKFSFHGTGNAHYTCRATEKCKAHENWAMI